METEYQSVSDEPQRGEQQVSQKSAATLAVAMVGCLVVGVAAMVFYLRIVRFQPVHPSSQEEVYGWPSPSEIVTPTPTPYPLITPPETKVLSSGVQVFQTFNNCGPASLSMALSHYNIQVSQEELGRDLRPHQNPQGINDDKSVILPELAAKAHEYGFLTYHRPAGDMEKIRMFITHDMPVITRTWLKPSEDIGHYRVVKGFDQVAGEIIQDDSLQGANLRYSYEDFNELWRAFGYEYLVLVPPEKQEIAEAILGEDVHEQSAWEKALHEAQMIADIDPEDIYAHFNVSVALFRLGRYNDSVAAYERVEHRLPLRMLWYQIEPIRAYYETGDYDRVFEITERILSGGNAAFSELYHLRGMSYRAIGDEELAQESFRQAQKYNPGYALY